MSRFRVLLTGVVDKSPEGTRAFFTKFAAAYKIEFGQAEQFFRDRQAVGT